MDKEEEGEHEVVGGEEGGSGGDGNQRHQREGPLVKVYQNGDARRIFLDSVAHTFKVAHNMVNRSSAGKGG